MTSSPLNFSISYPRAFLRFALLFVATFLIFFSLVGNSSPSERNLWLLDTSLSMAAQDIQGEKNTILSRMDVARSVILSGIGDSLAENALITFDDVARLQLPFSRDIGTFSAIVSSIEPKIYGGSTDIAILLSSINLIYPHESFRAILLSDGEESGTGGIYPELPPGVQLSIVVIGSADGGPMLQGYDANGKPRYKQYEGENAISRPDLANVERMAEKYNAKVYHIERGDDIQGVIGNIVRQKGVFLVDSSYRILLLGVMLFTIALILKPYTQKQEQLSQGKYLSS